MNTSFERSTNPTDEWYTPKWIIESLGEFDLDPCAPEKPLWATAKRHFTASDNGLAQNWGGGENSRVAQSALFSPSYRTICSKDGRTQQRHCIVI